MLIALTLKFTQERCLGNLHVRLLRADWESLVCPHCSMVSPGSSVPGSPCGRWPEWSSVVRAGWVTPARGFAPAVPLPLQGHTGDRAAPARALCHDTEAGLLDWGKQKRSGKPELR